jgi:hypothetical protein
VGGRIADRPWSPRATPEGVRTRRGGPDRPTASTRPDHLPERCRAVDGAVSVAVAPRRTTGSRRRADPGGRPTSVPRHTPFDPCLYQRICRSSPGAGGCAARPIVDRAHPVDTDVEPVCPWIHNGAPAAVRANRAGHPSSGPTGSDRDRKQ